MKLRYFNQALAIAREQGAKIIELRTATSLNESFSSRPRPCNKSRSATILDRNYTQAKLKRRLEQVAKSVERYLLDLSGASREFFIASKFGAFPTFPQTVPNLADIVAHDAQATPPDKYRVVANALEWHTNLGHPGYTNAAVDEIYWARVVPAMFAAAAGGKMTPAEALTQADQEVRGIFDKWRALEKI